jgi:hypothetical protein
MIEARLNIRRLKASLERWNSIVRSRGSNNHRSNDVASVRFDRFDKTMGAPPIMRLTDCGKEGPQVIVNFSRVLIVDPVSGMLKSAAGELTELSSFQRDALLNEFNKSWERLSA